MSYLSAQQVTDLVETSIRNLNTQFLERIDRLNAEINTLKPPVVEQFLPVEIDQHVGSGNASLDLIKSLPEFDGDTASYPAWRSAANFAMKYYPENSEKFYVATGILRNKIIGSANSTLSSFNTVLNYKAVIARLDQTYADKRPLHVLENELSVLRQNNSSIMDFYDAVDKQLTLITNKQIMTFSGQDDLIAALTERARENALRIFISGLRRPICDILFSAKPKDLPTALVTAQELETNHRRNDFARAYAAGSYVNSTKNKTPPQQFSKLNQVTPMEVDSSRFHNRNQKNPQNPIFQQTNAFQNRIPSNFRSPNNTGAIPKRNRESTSSNRNPFFKQQRINHMPATEDIPNENEINSDSEDESHVSDFEDDLSNNEINFLG